VVQSKPGCSPAFENGWHGKPAKSKSFAGTSSISTPRMVAGGLHAEVLLVDLAQNLVDFRG
jgi:hypothetical protein